MKKKYKKFKIICRNCKEEAEASYKTKIYCSEKCRNIWKYHHDPKTKERVIRQTRERYNKIKDTPEYKKYRAEYFKRWLKDNREHYNYLMREPNKLRSRRLHKEDIMRGHCTKCHQPKKDRRFRYCLSCRKKLRVKPNKKIYIVRSNSNNKVKGGENENKKG